MVNVLRMVVALFTPIKVKFIQIGFRVKKNDDACLGSRATMAEKSIGERGSANGMAIGHVVNR